MRGAPSILRTECRELVRDEKQQLSGRKDCVMMYGMANVIIQPPFGIGGVQPYVTGGVGLYREALLLHEQTGVGLNTGGGVKVSLIGPLRLRIDYRVFRLGDAALHSPAHRIYAGINLRF